MSYNQLGHVPYSFSSNRIRNSTSKKDMVSIIPFKGCTGFPHYLALGFYLGNTSFWYENFTHYESPGARCQGGGPRWQSQGRIQDLMIVGLKLPFWGLNFVEFWCWGIFGDQGGAGPPGPPPGSAPESSIYMLSFLLLLLKFDPCVYVHIHLFTSFSVKIFCILIYEMKGSTCCI